ncbi:twin-arginine translocation signal domain-containing protein, partial [Dickeya dianthicola]|nr:twin-arginine translocation signal domain-containing protein [Dickeya dianthicola]
MSILRREHNMNRRHFIKSACALSVAAAATG